MQPYATIADLEARYPAELTLLAADEATGLRDDIRIGLALNDSSIEIRAILAARYSAGDLASFTDGALDVLRVYCGDMALYRVALSFARSSDAVKERYDQAVKRLEAIASGKGALETTSSSSAGYGTRPVEAGDIGQNEVVLSAPERVFTRERLGRI